MNYGDIVEHATMQDDPYGRMAPFNDGDEVTIIVKRSARRYRLSAVQRSDDGSVMVTLIPVSESE